MQKHFNRLAVAVALVGIALVSLTSVAHAANVTWNLPGSGNWDISSPNWTVPTNYTDGDNATFNFNNAAGGTITVAGPGGGGAVAPGLTALSNAINTAPATFTFSGGSITSGNITKTGGGIVTLNNAYTGTGTITASAGTLNVNGGAANATGYIANGGTLNLGFSYSGTTPLTATSGAIGITNGATWTLNANPTGNGTISIGTGTIMNMTASNQFADTLGIGGGGTLNMSGFSDTFRWISGSYSLTNIGNVIVSNNTTIDRTGGTVSGSGSLTFGAGHTGQSIINGTYLHSGGTFIDAGIVSLYGTSGQLPATGQVTVNAGGTLHLQYTGHSTSPAYFGQTKTIGALNGLGSILSHGYTGPLNNPNQVINNANSNLIFQIGNGGGSGTFGGVFSGGGSIVKLGAGTQVFNGNNTYTGTTTISGGKLIVNGVTGPAQDNYAVQSGATLGGSGTINLAATKAVTILSGGILEPGNSAGTMTINGGLNLNNGAILKFELGTPSDKVIVNGLLTGSASAGGITLNLTQLNPFGSFVLFDWTNGSVASFDVSDFNVVGGSGTLSIVGSQLIYSIPVPEPTSLALLGLGLVALVRKGRRQRKA